MSLDTSCHISHIVAIHMSQSHLSPPWPAPPVPRAPGNLLFPLALKEISHISHQTGSTGTQKVHWNYRYTGSTGLLEVQVHWKYRYTGSTGPLEVQVQWKNRYTGSTGPLEVQVKGGQKK